MATPTNKNVLVHGIPPSYADPETQLHEVRIAAVQRAAEARPIETVLNSINARLATTEWSRPCKSPAMPIGSTRLRSIVNRFHFSATRLLTNWSPYYKLLLRRI